LGCQNRDLQYTRPVSASFWGGGGGGFVFNKTTVVINCSLVWWLKIQNLWRTWISACVYIRTFSFAGF